MEQIYHPWHKWECYPAGFYESRPTGRNLSEGVCKYMYAQFLRDIPRFEAAMAGVVNDWPNSCEHYLSNERMDRITWLKQAAVCHVSRVPAAAFSDKTLTESERETADLLALHYLNRWLEAHDKPPLLTLKDAERTTQPELY
jgi:hypothetical protein